MIGQLVWTGRRLWRPRLAEDCVRGLPILRAELPGTSGDRRAPRRWLQGAQLLRRQGCGRLLLTGGSPAAPLLPPVSTRALWQQMAAPLALAFLRQAGIPPERAVVTLRGDRVTRPLFQACCQLMGAVRALSLDIPRGGEELAWWLERQHGVPVLSGRGDVGLCFAPRQEDAQQLALWPELPALPGFTLSLRSGALPEGYPALPLLAALLEEGRVTPDEVQVLPQSPIALPPAFGV